MAKNVELCSNVSITEDSQGHKAYDNREIKPGEILVPMMATESRIETMGADRSNIRIRSTAGRSYKVMFYPVPEDYKQMAMQQFNFELNEFLGERRDARCYIPQDDGSLKLCPKKSGNNRCACVDCPHHGEYQREDKSIASLDQMIEEHEYEPVSQRDDTELVLLKMTYDDLIQYLKKLNPRYAKIVSLGFDIGSDGIHFAAGDKEELVKKVIKVCRIRKSRAYQEVNNALAIVETYLYN